MAEEGFDVFGIDGKNSVTRIGSFAIAIKFEKASGRVELTKSNKSGKFSFEIGVGRLGSGEANGLLVFLESEVKFGGFEELVAQIFNFLRGLKFLRVIVQ